MPNTFQSLAFTPAVLALQETHGSRRQYARMQASGAGQEGFGDFEQGFLAARDSFYLATTSSAGWPYIQHRGGPQGFLKVIDNRTLALADFRGNKQYITTGNLQTNDRVALILVDYPRQARMKILGTMEVFEGDSALPWLDRVKVPGYEAVIERIFVIHVEGFDWNCPQHITPRYTSGEIHAAIEPLEARIRTLEDENRKLKNHADHSFREP